MTSRKVDEKLTPKHLKSENLGKPEQDAVFDLPSRQSAKIFFWILALWIASGMREQLPSRVEFAVDVCRVDPVAAILAAILEAHVPWC